MMRRKGKKKEEDDDGNARRYWDQRWKKGRYAATKKQNLKFYIFLGLGHNAHKRQMSRHPNTKEKNEFLVKESFYASIDDIVS